MPDRRTAVPNDSVMYVFTMDPAVKGADYLISNILAEAYPSEAQALWKRYADAFSAGQIWWNLTLIADLAR